VSSAVQLPSVEQPLVSVVMVTYGAGDLARQAITALVEGTEPVYELIVVDNASPDGAGKQLAGEIEDARIVLNDENLGFGRAANQGAQMARGRLVCQLNSDALVEPGWLPPLVETLEDDPSVGAVVPLILNPDGTVQEAGSVLDWTGWALALGSGGGPYELDHRFRREIDFGSAACMLLRADDFAAIGGFDPSYGAGYYEDVDLCFRLKAGGLRTIFEPRSRVVHVRFGSSGEERARRLVQENRLLFFARWRERLAERQGLSDLPSAPHRLVAARDAEAAERVLVIDDRVPHVDRGSGDPRMANLLYELADLWPHARVTLFGTDCSNAETYAQPLLARGIEVACAEGDFGRWFDERRFHYSVVIVSRPQNFERVDGLLRRTQPQALRVFDVEALSSERLTLAAGFARDDAEGAMIRREAERTRSLEGRAIRAADAIFCVTDEERQSIERLAPETATFLLPTYVETDAHPPPFGERRDLVFFGAFLGGAGSPNEDALMYLVADVLPLIREELPDVVLHVVGADPTPDVRALHGNGVNVVGFVDDPADWLRRARVHVNPLRFGAGVKLKLLDTMAAGLPFATTTIGAQGLGLGELGPELMADRAEDLARLTCSLYRDRESWQRAQRGLLQIARTRFDRETFRQTLVEAMTTLGFSPPRTVGGTERQPSAATA